MRPRLVSLAIALSVLLCAPVHSHAQEPPATPEAATEAYFAALRAGDWEGVAALMHPDALAQFHNLFLSLVQAEGDGAAAEVPSLFGVKNVAAFAALSPREAFARFLAGVVRLSPDMAAILGSAQVEVIGHVPEGPDTVHVVYRMQMGMDEVSLSKITVLTMKRSGGQWLSLLTGDLQGLVSALSTDP